MRSVLFVLGGMGLVVFASHVVLVGEILNKKVVIILIAIILSRGLVTFLLCVTKSFQNRAPQMV